MNSPVSPFTAFIFSFIPSSLPSWLMVLVSIIIYWFLLFLPPVFALQYLDIKLGADIQTRIGPNRSSRFGIFQVLINAIKSFFKEEISLPKNHHFLFKLSPLAATVCVFLAQTNIPMTENLLVSDFESNLFFIFGMLILSHLFIFLGIISKGGAPSILSAFQILIVQTVYIIPITVALIPPVLIAGSLNLEKILYAQGGAPWNWFIFHDPGTFLSCFVLIGALQMWQARSPFIFFDELVSEYSGFRKEIFYFFEYASFFLACTLIVVVYLGGSKVPFDLSYFGRAATFFQWVVFLTKILFVGIVSIWLKWSLPKLPIDQMVRLSWKVLIPTGLLAAAITLCWQVVTLGEFS